MVDGQSSRIAAAHTRPLDFELRRSEFGGVSPFILSLLGEAASGAGDPEVFLDSSANNLYESEGRSGALARARVARWRGDSAAAELWTARAKTLASLCRDDDTALLCRVAVL